MLSLCFGLGGLTVSFCWGFHSVNMACVSVSLGLCSPSRRFAFSVYRFRTLLGVYPRVPFRFVVNRFGLLLYVFRLCKHWWFPFISHPAGSLIYLVLGGFFSSVFGRFLGILCTDTLSSGRLVTCLSALRAVRFCSRCDDERGRTPLPGSRPSPRRSSARMSVGAFYWDAEGPCCPPCVVNGC